jgi:hypothetical protein
MSESEEPIELWKEAMARHQTAADKATNPDIRASHLTIIESYRRLIANETTFTTLSRTIRSEGD